MSDWDKILKRDALQDTFKLFRLRGNSALLEGLGSEGIKNIIMHTMTAIGAWGGFPDPPVWWNDFMKGRDSNMLRMRKDFVERLEAMHVRTLAKHSDMKTRADEDAAYEVWKTEQESKPKRRKQTGPLMPCPCCQRFCS